MTHRLARVVALVVLMLVAGMIPVASQAVGAQPAGTTFTSPSYGYSLVYDASWVIPANAPSHTADTLYLTNGLSSVVATAGTNFNGDAQTCLTQTRDSISHDSGVASFAPSGTSLPNNAGLPQSADTATLTPPGGSPVELTIYLQCQPIAPGQTTLLLEAIAPQDAAADQAAAIGTLFGSVTQPQSGHLPASVPSATLTPVAPATLLPLPTGAPLAVTGDGVNLRAQPAISGQVVAVLPAGTSLTVTGPAQTADGYTWSPVTAGNGVQGYIASQLTTSPTALAAAAPANAAPAANNAATTQDQSDSSSAGVADTSGGGDTASSAGNAPGDTYTNVDGNQVQRPMAAPAAPAGATAQCTDGTYSFSQHHQGTCSHHGGVAQWLQ